MESRNSCSPSTKKPHITPPEVILNIRRRICSKDCGYENSMGAHDLCTFKDILPFHVYPRLGWESEQDVEKSCKRWRLWYKDNPAAIRDNAMLGERTAMKKWIVDDIIYNNSEDLMAWLEDDMSAYRDVFLSYSKEKLMLK